MSDPDPNDRDQMKMGDLIALFVDPFSPPTMDHARAVEALSQWAGVKSVWICPLSGDSDEHVRNMASVFTLDFASSNKNVSYCTIALDKKMASGKEALEWVKTKFPYFKFQLAVLSPKVPIETEQFFQIALGPGTSTSNGATGIVLEKFLPVPVDLKARIAGGSDESRNVVTPVWDYIQKKRLYR